MTPLLDKMKAGRRRWLAAAAGVGVALALSACAVVDSGRAPATSASDAWVVLPIVNYTETPQAGLRAETIATSILKARGFTNLKQYPANLNSESLFEPAEREAVARALDWARGEKARYALTGAVDEWRYKDRGAGRHIHRLRCGGHGPSRCLGGDVALRVGFTACDIGLTRRV